MKTRLLIVFLFVSLIGTFGAGATDNIPINSVESLTESQQKTLEYTKKLFKKRKNRIALPVETYTILGDTSERVAPEASPIWEKAYFKKDADWKTCLVVPLKVVTPIGVMYSQLYVRSNAQDKYYRTVSTSLPTSQYLKKNPNVKRYDNDDFCGISINSNVDGAFLRAFYYQNGEIFCQVEGVIGNFGVIDGDDSIYINKIAITKQYKPNRNKSSEFEFRSQIINGFVEDSRYFEKMSNRPRLHSNQK